MLCTLISIQEPFLWSLAFHLVTSLRSTHTYFILGFGGLARPKYTSFHRSALGRRLQDVETRYALLRLNSVHVQHRCLPGCSYPRSFCPPFVADYLLANVTLKSKGGLIPPDRVLKLNPKASSISIGRASKSAAKNLTGSVDNAWFASPVMSRHHATLSLDPQKNVRNTALYRGTSVSDIALGA